MDPSTQPTSDSNNQVSENQLNTQTQLPPQPQPSKPQPFQPTYAINNSNYEKKVYMITVGVLVLIIICLGIGYSLNNNTDKTAKTTTTNNHSDDTSADYSLNDQDIKTRNTERQYDIKAIHAYVEAYYAQNGVYPSFSEINDSNFRLSNLKGLDDEAMQDPMGTSQTLVAAPIANSYAYAVTTDNGDPCDNLTTSTQCMTYTLTATLEGGGTYSKSNLN